MLRRLTLGVTAIILAAVALLHIPSGRIAEEQARRALEQALEQNELAGASPLVIETHGLPVRVGELELQVFTLGDLRGGVPPILLLHGTPGSASNFRTLAPAIAGTGRPVVWFDLPGFGALTERHGEPYRFETLSQRSYADFVWRVLDTLDIEQIHAVGWSNGGAAVLYMDASRPGDVLSNTLLASVGAQSTEGSGSYFFEHVKYGFGFATLVYGRSLLPHFGFPAPTPSITGFLRNFWDTDQRPLDEMLSFTRTPTLILHGRHDFLVSDLAAERHHEIAPASRLVMLDGSHFLPFTHTSEITEIIKNHANRHDVPGASPDITSLDLAPLAAPPSVLHSAYLWARDHVFDAPWWLMLCVLLLGARVRPSITSGIAALLVADVRLDIFLAWVGVSLGLGWRADRLAAKLIGAPLVACLATVIPFPLLHFGLRVPNDAVIPLWSLAALPLAYCVLAWVFTNAWTRRGRARLLAGIARPVRHEFWPTWAFYAPLVPYLLWLSIKHRGMMTFACCNPGIPNGGGMVGESKSSVMRGFREHPNALHCVLLGSGAQAEAEFAQHLESLGSFPVIIKPDAGQRGVGVKLARDEATAHRVLREEAGPLCAQRYHPGPNECGVLWHRDPEQPETGRVFGITHKSFPTVRGDGVRTIEHLILNDPRLRMQAGVFLERLGARAADVPKSGEVVRIAEAGNHSQGARFEDGEHLRSPQLEHTINELMLAYRGENGEPVDFGRFDLRYESPELLREGKGFGIVELNGTFSESTNLYDPRRSILWAYSILFAQWRTLYQIGAWRRRSGAKPPRLRELLAWLIEERRRAPARSVSD
ncbi:MAG: alpha/beta fold hydrolase [Planctomycetota bacterium]